MHEPPARLAATGILAIPGAVGAMSFAAAPAAAGSGFVAAGDDRGEAGVWDRAGNRLAALRLRGPVASADMRPDGGTAAFVTAEGDAAVVAGPSRVLRLRLRPGDRVLLDRTGDGFHVLSPATGRVEVRDAAGRVSRTFDVPGPVHAAVAVGRTGGLATVTVHGVLARVAPTGGLAWGADLRSYSGGLACDPRGETLVVCRLAHGAEVLQASSGARLGVVDLARPVECAALSARRLALGCSDGTLVLLDRSGRVQAEVRASSKLREIGVADDGTVVARLADGTVRSFCAEGAGAPGPATSGAGAAAGAPFAAAAAPAGSWRRRIWNPRAAAPTVVVAVSGPGRHLAAAQEGHRVLACAHDGSGPAESKVDGTVLALHVDADGETWVVSSREIRRVGDPGAASLRAFAAEWGSAAFSADGLLVAGIDETGTLRLVSRTSGADVAEAALPRTGTDRLVVSTVGAAVRTRAGGIVCLTPQGAAVAAFPESKEPPRLECAFRDGPVATAGPEVLVLAWDGRVRRRTRLRSVPLAVRPLPGGRLLVAQRDGLQVLSPEGRLEGPPAPRPEGRLAAAVPMSDGSHARLAWTDGRRLVVAPLRGGPLVDVTFESKVLAVALAASGATAAVVLEGHVTAIAVGDGAAAAGAGTGNPAPVRVASSP